MNVGHGMRSVGSRVQGIPEDKALRVEEAFDAWWIRLDQVR